MPSENLQVLSDVSGQILLALFPLLMKQIVALSDIIPVVHLVFLNIWMEIYIYLWMVQVINIDNLSRDLFAI